MNSILGELLKFQVKYSTITLFVSFSIYQILVIPTEVSITNKLDQINNFSELNNNEYYDDHTELILNELKTAIFQKKLETVKSLLQTHDLDVNVILKNEWTPLMHASSCGSYELCEYLIENGADIFFSDGLLFI